MDGRRILRILTFTKIIKQALGHLVLVFRATWEFGGFELRVGSLGRSRLNKTWAPSAERSRRRGRGRMRWRWRGRWRVWIERTEKVDEELFVGNGVHLTKRHCYKQARQAIEDKGAKGAQSFFALRVRLCSEHIHFGFFQPLKRRWNRHKERVFKH